MSDTNTKSINKPIQLGLCCMNITLKTARKPPIYPSRRMIQRKIREENGIDKLKTKIVMNLKDVLKMIEWNEENGIKVFRLSSDLFPHITNPNIPKYTLDFASVLLENIGNLAKKFNQRITFHPGQYNVVGSPNLEAYKKTVDDLSYHANMLDMMKLDKNSVMVVHGGGTYGDKNATKERWCRQFALLPENVRQRLVLENCEKNFNIEDCLEISSKINIPVVFDSHHFECYKKLHPGEIFKKPDDYMLDILNTWTKRSIKPKFHISEQGSGKIGHHSDFIENIPQYMLDIPGKYKINIDIMVEAKKKELAIFKLYRKYPELNCLAAY